MAARQSRKTYAGVDVRTLPIQFRKATAGRYISTDGDYAIHSERDRGVAKWYVHDRNERSVRGWDDRPMYAFTLPGAIHDLHYRIGNGIVLGFEVLRNQYERERQQRDAEYKRECEIKALMMWLLARADGNVVPVRDWSAFAGELWTMGARVQP